MADQSASASVSVPHHRSTSTAGWQKAVSTAGGHWGWLVFDGALTLIIGILALVWPGATLLVIAVLFAITLLVNGFVLVVMGIADTDESGGRRVLLGLLGALSILAGALCLRSPLQTLAVIALLVGAWWVVSGVLMCIESMTNAAEGHRGWILLRGLVSLVAGLIVLFQPGISLLTLEIILGIVFIALGALMIVDAFLGRRAQQRLARTKQFAPA